MKVYHLNIMTDELAKRMNSGEVDRDTDPRCRMYYDITWDGNEHAAACAYSEGEYKEVALVPDGNCLKSLDAAYAMTQNLSEGGWIWEFSQRKILRQLPEYCHTSVIGGSARSTSVGDILERDGHFYMVAGVGFVELEQLRKEAS